jgi:hypothetical protein
VRGRWGENEKSKFRRRLSSLKKLIKQRYIDYEKD